MLRKFSAILFFALLLTGCGGGSSTDSGSTDSGSTDSGSTDSGSTDSGSTDSGSTDSGSTDSGSTAGDSTACTSVNSPLASINRPLVTKLRTYAGDTITTSDNVETLTELNDKNYIVKSTNSFETEYSNGVIEISTSSTTQTVELYEPVSDKVKIKKITAVSDDINSDGNRMSETVLTYDPYALVYESKACNGQVRSQTYSFTISTKVDGSLSHEGSGKSQQKDTMVNVNENINVPAGSFNTVHWISRTYDVDGNLESKREVWQEPESGALVKEVYYSSETKVESRSELIAFTY